MSSSANAVPTFVSGYPFEAWLADQGRTSPADAASIVAAIATQVHTSRGAGFAPGQAIPAGLRIDSSGSPRLDVSSAAAAAGAGGRGIDGKAADACAARGAFGPPPGEVPDERSDVYGLGVVLYHLLSGRFPFSGSNPVEQALAHRHEIPQPPSLIAPGVPEALDAVALACLSKDPTARPPSLAQLADRLTGKLPEERPAPAPPSEPAPLSPAEPIHSDLETKCSPVSAASRGPRWGGSVIGVLAVASTVAIVAVGPRWSSTQVGDRIHLVSSAPEIRITPSFVSEALPSTTPTGARDTAAAEASAAESDRISASPAVAPTIQPVTKSGPQHPASPAQSGTATARRPSGEAPRTIALSGPSTDPTAAVTSPPAAGGEAAKLEATRLIAEGDALLRQKKYLGGDQPGALDRYREALSVVPAQPAVLAKVEMIRTTYLALVRDRREKGDFPAARRYLEGLEHAFPGDPMIATELLAIDAERAASSRVGRLDVDVHPWGNVFVDGHFVDQTPMAPVQLEAGRHTVEVEGEQGRRKSIAITIRGGESQRVSIDLARNDG